MYQDYGVYLIDGNNNGNNNSNKNKRLSYCTEKIYQDYGVYLSDGNNTINNNNNNNSNSNNNNSNKNKQKHTYQDYEAYIITQIMCSSSKELPAILFLFKLTFNEYRC
ncbi:hypothetical protein ElyMa_002622500 [Elysia marginata]|uniref:Uncharacterized protein n=1 Tax=Elysia marginata TaxID=1093978 RepID=A0AAV4H315_9GAST|nr:hypothetical protein ElyMa_002622500 [Elysia marginata]